MFTVKWSGKFWRKIFMIRLTQKQQTWLVSAGLFGLTLALYWPVRHFDFINYDDPDYFANNWLIQQGLTMKGSIWAFTEAHFSNWHPLVWVSYMFECQFFGVKPAVPHLGNAILHATNGVLLFILLQKWTWAIGRSALVAALFLFHPTRVESVAWIAERKDVLSGLFFMLTLWAYTQFKVQSLKFKAEDASLVSVRFPLSSRYYYLALFFFALGLMSKPMLVTLPFLLLVLDFWPWQRTVLDQPKKFLPLVMEKWPFFVLAGLCSLITVITQSHGGAVADLPFYLRWQKPAMTVPAYLKELFWPGDLTVLYLSPVTWPIVSVLGALAIILLIFVAALFQGRSRPWLLTGWLWFLGMLIPVMGIVQAGVQFIADRFTYLPAVGIFLPVVWGGWELLSRLPFPLRKISAIIGALVLVMLSVGLSRHQLYYWQDSKTLWEHALRVDPKNYVAHNSLGIYLADHGNVEAAITEYETAVRLQPKLTAAWNGLGLIALRGKDYSKAADLFQRALACDPDNPFTLANLGKVFDRAGDYARAGSFLKKALQLDSEDINVQRAVAAYFDDIGKIDQAIPHYQKILEHHPSDAVNHCNLAIDLMAAGRPADALSHYETALSLDPGVPDFHYYHGSALIAGGRWQEGIVELRETLRLAPKHLGALNDLAWQLAIHAKDSAGNVLEALPLAERACELTGQKDGSSLSILDTVYASLGRFPEAVATAEKARLAFLAAGDTNYAQKAEARSLRYRASQPLKN